ncbi:MAG: hypothetical protein N3A61_07325, partial [Ignavibacteria bacterium]|nr:hypothetical protein [Ignavibacteria bacterium]
VKDTKKVEYFFNLDAIRVNHKSPNDSIFDSQKFINCKVVDNITNQARLEGKVINIIEEYSDGFPKILLVEWENKKLTSEYVIHNEDTQKYLKFLCPQCKSELKKYYCNGDTSCPNCKLKLWKNNSSVPILVDEAPFKTSSELKYRIENSSSLPLIREKDYFGKFKYVSKINMGASPGARSSTQDEYFSVQRFYNVNQNLVADYLNLKREVKGLSKIEFTKLFPDDYIHTVGHWLRKDMGGSLPQIVDWERIIKILDIESSYTNYVCRKALKLQIVKNSHKGKNPGDYLEMSIDEVKSFLKKTFSEE